MRALICFLIALDILGVLVLVPGYLRCWQSYTKADRPRSFLEFHRESMAYGAMHGHLAARHATAAEIDDAGRRWEAYVRMNRRVPPPTIVPSGFGSRIFRSRHGDEYESPE